MFVFPPLPAPGPGLSQRLTLVVQALRAAIAAHAARDRAAVALAWLVWHYLKRLAARFTALAARVSAGKLAVVSRAMGLRAASEVARLRPPGLPHGFAWLIRLAPSTVALRGQVCHLLGDPELVALLAAAPGAGRILRPLCRMLGIEAGPDFPPALFQRPDPPPMLDLTLAASEPPAASPSPAPQPQPQSPAPSRPPPRRHARPHAPVFRMVLA